MASLIWLVGAVIAALGGWIVFQPIRLTSLLRWVQTSLGLYFASLIRIAIGVIMLVWARSCHRPAIIIIIGILAVLGGMVLILLPRSRIQKLIQWFQQRPQWIYRLWGIAAVAFGILIIWAGWPK